MKTLTVRFSEEELDALKKMAASSFRTCEEQIRYWVITKIHSLYNIEVPDLPDVPGNDNLRDEIVEAMTKALLEQREHLECLIESKLAKPVFKQAVKPEPATAYKTISYPPEDATVESVSSSVEPTEPPTELGKDGKQSTAYRIFRELGLNPDKPRTRNEIAGLIGVPKSTAHNTIGRMISRGYIKEVSTIHSGYRGRQEGLVILTEASRQILRKFAQRTGGK